MVLARVDNGVIVTAEASFNARDGATQGLVLDKAN